MTRILRLHSDDNVIVAVEALQSGELAEGVLARARIPKGHKMAVSTMAKGQPVLKFGQIIGFASADISPGDWVHEHNVEMQDFARDYQFAAAARTEDILPVEQRATFQGYRRANGSVGTRNYIAILTSVNCSASVARFMAREVERSGILAHYPNIDGIIPLVHGTGCGMAAKGEGFDILKRTQWGYASHPNIGGVLLVGLGCEVFQISRMKQEFNIVENDLFRTMTIQDTGGTRKTVEAGVARILEMLPAVNAVQRETVPASELMLALQCGGSAYGCKPTPSMKLATNSDIYNRMVEDMDINCGDVLDGVSIEEKGAEIFAALLRMASGEKSKSEALGYGDAEFVPWQIGATM